MRNKLDESKQRKENRFQNQRIKFNKTNLQILLIDGKKSRDFNSSISIQVDQFYFPSQFLSFHIPTHQIPVFQPSG